MGDQEIRVRGVRRAQVDLDKLVAGLLLLAGELAEQEANEAPSTSEESDT